MFMVRRIKKNLSKATNAFIKNKALYHSKHTIIKQLSSTWTPRPNLESFRQRLKGGIYAL